MAERTGIEWCDATFNPWIGCEKVSPGCAHCYAETLVEGRMGRGGAWGADGVRQVTSPSNWKKPLRWARLAREGLLPNGEPNRDGHRPRIFCASLADVFEPRPELEEPRRNLFALIEQTPELDWLLLTKRPEFARAWLFENEPYMQGGGFVTRDGLPWGLPPNVWLGTSIENARHTYRADVLREIPAAVRFISAEPLLGSLFPTYDGGNDGDAVRADRREGAAVGDVALRVQDHVRGEAGRGSSDPRLRRDPVSVARRSVESRAPLDLTGIDWVIVGGESGPGARPFDVEWAREIIRASGGFRCCDSGYYCPAAGENECAVHGGFDVCCEHPERHEQRRGPAVFVKQLGAQPTHVREFDRGELVGLRYTELLNLRDRKGGDWDEWPADLRIREFPASAAVPA